MPSNILARVYPRDECILAKARFLGAGQGNPVIRDRSMPRNPLESGMKIAQIAPLTESVPPRFYGGTERIVSYLTEELVRLGHKVTLFASGDSVTRADLVSCARTALRLDPNVRDPIPYYMLMLDRIRERFEDFDVLHFHFDQLHFPIFKP